MIIDWITSKKRNLDNYDRLYAMLGHSPGGTSFKNLIHFN